MIIEKCRFIDFKTMFASKLKLTLNKKKMKKITLIASAVVLMGGLLTSCVKERVCECTYTDNGQTKTEVVNITSTGGATKLACEMMTSAYATDQNASCKLK